MNIEQNLKVLLVRDRQNHKNPAFQSKMFLLVFAGINMAYFHYKLFRTIDQYDHSKSPPRNVKIAGVLSLVLWSGVMLAGRWIGHII